MDWVTDPKAIDVIVELKELRQGDEVLIVGAEHYGLPLDWEGTWLKVSDGEVAGLKEEYATTRLWGKEPPVTCVDDTLWIICRKNIAAWRRPGAHKE